MLAEKFRNHIRFALHKEARHLREKVQINRVEQLGNILAWLAYGFPNILRNIVKDPRFLTVIFTILCMTLTALLFYPLLTWEILGDGFRWVRSHINWGIVRFSLFIISEITVLGLGVRAFGRFSNRELMSLHGLS